MSNLKPIIHKTLSTRLSFWVVTFTALLFVAVLWIMLWFARQAIKEEACEKAHATLNSAVLSIDNQLAKIETATHNMLWNVEHHLDDPELMMELSRRLVEANPNIEGCAIAFLPGFYPSKGQYYMAYHHRLNGNIICSDNFGNTPYAEQEWYSYPMQTNKTEWIDPESVSKFSPHPIITYSIPVHRLHEQDTPVAVLAVDISLDWLSHTIQDARPFPNTYCSLINQKGSFIIHPDTAILGPGTIQEQLAKYPSAENERLTKAMLNGESGRIAMKLYGQDSYVFYRPFKNTGWSIDIACPKNEIFASYYQLRWLAIGLTIAGLLVLLFFCLYYIKWQLRPLFKLDATVQWLAEGHFDKLLEPTSRQDEIGHMQRVFSNMQQSLAKYLEEITLQQKSLDEQGEALRIAYEQAKEAENAKAAFMHSATDQLTRPVSAISDIVGRIHRERTHLSYNEIVEITRQMEEQTNQMTDLLERMITVATASNSQNISQNT